MNNFLIIGGSSGIGQTLAGQLASLGHKVFATYFSKTNQDHSGLVSYHYLNVLEDNLSMNFLPDDITGLIYCPGSITLKPFERMKASDFASDYQLQVLGAIKVIQLILPKLRMAVNPSILLFSSVAVQTGLAYHAQISATKGAIEGLTRALAAEFAPKIRVNCIAPSLVDTPLAASFLKSDSKKESNALRHPLKKIGSAIDIANMAEYLISEKAGWISGQIFHVDGGMSALKT